MVDYYVTKAEEFVNPANPEEGKTGKMIIIMNEVYPNPEEIGNHMNVAQKWSGMGGLLQLLKDYDATILMEEKLFRHFELLIYKGLLASIKLSSP